MRREKQATLTLLLLALTLLAIPAISTVADAESTTVQGPREDDMSMTFYATQEAAYTALIVGEIDLMLFDLTSAQVDNAFTDPNIVTCQVPDSGIYQFDLNNNYTISDHPSFRSPMNYTEMRQACAFLSDKDYYVSTLMGGLASRIDQMIPATYSDWKNEFIAYPYYPYEYSPAAAKSALDSKFPEGSSPNPDYDPVEPLSSMYLRQYPVGHAMEGQDLDPLKFCIRADHTPRLQAGRALVSWLKKLGVPIASVEGSGTLLYPIVMEQMNFHCYTGGWSVGTLPSTYLHDLYGNHSAYPGGPNYVTGRKTHPHLDALLDLMISCRDVEAIASVQSVLRHMTELCVNVPLWTTTSYWAWSNRLLGVVNMDGLGPENDYTFMNAYKADGSPIRCGTTSFPAAVNSVYSSWVYDYNVLNRMNLYSGMVMHPYDLSIDQPGFSVNWETTTWNDGGTSKTMVTRSYADDAYFCKPVSGNQGEHVNASHYFFNAWLDYQVGDGWWSNEYRNLHHIDITSTYEVEIYFDTLSYWNTYAATGPLRPMDLWASIPTMVNTTTEVLADPTTPGIIPLNNDPIYINSIDFDGTPLVHGTDWNIVLGNLEVFTALGTGTLEVQYCYITSPTAFRGYTPGSQPWQTSFEGAGMYYCTSFDPVVGATFHRNPYYYQETPPLGEVDFLYHWSDGCYAIDELDVDLVNAAWGSQGTGVPSLNWFPGADLSVSGGVIDAFDLTAVIGANWGTEWGHAGVRSRNITVTDIVPSQETVTLPEVVAINVTVENRGRSTETFDLEVFLSVYADTVSLAKQTVSNLASGASTTRTFEWNPTGYLTGPYKITALTTKVPHEDNVNDNTFTYCMVTLNATTMHTLKVTPHPDLATLLPLTLNGTRLVAPWNGGLQAGTYIVEAPATVVDGSLLYHFQKWEDDTTNATRTIQLTSDLNITVYYESSPQPLATSSPSTRSPAPSTLYLSPSVINAVPFDTFTINLSIANAEDLYSWQLKLHYDTRFIDAYWTDIAEGPFLQTGGSTILQHIVDDAYNATHGVLWMNTTLMAGSSGVTGSGILAHITLRSRAIGNSVAILSETSLCNSTRHAITHQTLEGLGLIRTRLKADINNDGVINIFDLVLIAGAYGTTLGHEKYSVHYDMIVNRAIDIFDLVYIAMWYGRQEQGYRGPIDRDQLPIPLIGPRRGTPSAYE